MSGLDIVRGNDFYISIPITDILMVRDLDCGVINTYYAEQTVQLDKYTIVEVNIVPHGGEGFSATWVMENGLLIIECDDKKLEKGRYGIEVIGKYDSRDTRYYKKKMFRIVDESKGCPICDYYNGKPLYNIGQNGNITLSSGTTPSSSAASAYEPGTGENSAQLVGSGSVASGKNSHAEGQKTEASGIGSHSEGWLSKAVGSASHTEGMSCMTVGAYSHAGGLGSKTDGGASFAHGVGLQVSNTSEAAFGKYNDSKRGESTKDSTVFSIGCGTSAKRMNAFEVRQNGDVYIVYTTDNETRYICLQDLLSAMLEGQEAVQSVISGSETNNGMDANAWVGDMDEDSGAWYVGQVTTTAEGFAAMTADELLSVADIYPVTEKESTFNINKSCWFVMVPDGVEVQSASYTDGGIVSSFDDEEVAGEFGSDVHHGDVTINGLTYHVYVNRNTALVDSNAIGNFTLKQS